MPIRKARSCSVRVFPDKPIDRLKLLVFPFKVYVVVAPILFLISKQSRPHQYSATDAETYLVLGLLVADLVLLFAALVCALHVSRRVALPCLWFALAGIIAAVLLLPELAKAKTKAQGSPAVLFCT